MPAPTRETLLLLLSDARIQGSQLETTVARALDADYWRALAPDCHIGRADSLIEFAPDDPRVVDDAIAAAERDGYFRLPGLIAAEGIERMNAAIDKVTADGWPASFVFVYDELWRSARSPASSRVLESVLGPGFRQICNVWAHVVKPVAGASGWSPHVDGDAGRRMTLWMALTPATLDNGCMHVVPSAATSPDLIQRFRTDHTQFTRSEVTSMLHSARALVAAPGDALGWGFDVIHWGGFARGAGPERRALSFEYAAAGQAAAESGAELIDMRAIPPFEDRLRYIVQGLGWYTKFEPMVKRFDGVAAEIIKRLKSSG